MWLWLRWGLVSVSLLTVSALAFTLWSSHKQTQDIMQQVLLAEGHQLLNQFRTKMKEVPNPIQTKDLQRVFKSMNNTGIRYVALHRRRGWKQAYAGKTQKRWKLSRTRPLLNQVIRIAPHRYRLISFGLQPSPKDIQKLRALRAKWWRLRFGEQGSREHIEAFYKRRRELRSLRRIRRKRWRRRLHRRGLFVVLEFRPTVAPTLRTGSQRTLFVGLCVGCTLLLLSGIFWFVLIRLEHEEKKRENAEQLALLGEMSAVLAHEIRNPLTSLKGHAQLLSEYLEEGSKQHQKSERVVAEAIRLERLSNDLLDFVRAGQLKKEETSLEECIRGIIESSKIPKERIECTFSSSPQSCSIDRVKVRQVIENLIQNAEQASPEGSVVSVSTRYTHKHAHVWVRDYGAGIPPEQLQKIFTPFFTTKTQGTGLGLAVAQRFVRLHGGTLTAHNHASGGALFTLTLPLEKL